MSAALGAIVGQMAGYWIGWGVGFRLLRRYGRYIWLNDRRLAYGSALFRHGEKVVFAARFVVLLRTLAALLAGANHMPLGRFMVANVAGSVAWAVLYGMGAYMLGHEAKHVAGPVAIGICAIVVAALVVAGLHASPRAPASGTAGARRPPSQSNEFIIIVFYLCAHKQQEKSKYCWRFM